MPSLLLICALSIALLFSERTVVLADDDNSNVKDGPALSIDAGADRHPIDPNIYGMAFPDQALAKEISLPLTRLGGDGVTRYNWQLDSSNAGDDFYFMAGLHDANPVVPSAGPDKVITDAKSHNGRALITVPFIDYVNSATAPDSSYPVSIFGPQQKVNPYVHPTINGQQTDAGNGRTPDGKPLPTLTKEQILRTNIENTPDFQRGWIKHLVQTFGTTEKGGVAVYEMDNEPSGWTNTHRDIRSEPIGHDELVQKTEDYGSMIKEVDPSALILGPGDFTMHYQGNGKPGDGAEDHGGVGQGTYFLKKMQAYESDHGSRLLDYFDEHYYSMDQAGQSEQTILERTRSLWDPDYVENNWVGRSMGAIRLIPRFHEWVDQNYPGTKVSISEYGWGDMSKLTNALAEADVLGIFGRERLDLACLWSPPKVDQAGANAFRLYLNYNGSGGKYGDTWIQSKSDNQGKLSVYGAQRSSDHVVTLIVINKTADDLKSAVSLAGLQPTAGAKVFRFSAADLTKLVPQPDQDVSSSGFTATFPAKSATLIAIPAGG